MDAYLIDSDDLKAISLINNNVEDSIIRVTIQRVQKAVVRPILGTLLYKRLVKGIEDSDLNADEVILLEDYIAPLMAAACDRKAINHTTYQIRNKTTGKGLDPNITAVDQGENLRLDNDIRQDIEVAKDDLIGYLRDNCELYPQYKDYQSSFENKAPLIKKKFNGISFI